MKVRLGEEFGTKFEDLPIVYINDVSTTDIETGAATVLYACEQFNTMYKIKKTLENSEKRSFASLKLADAALFAAEKTTGHWIEKIGLESNSSLDDRYTVAIETVGSFLKSIWKKIYNGILWLIDKIIGLFRPSRKFNEKVFKDCMDEIKHFEKNLEKNLAKKKQKKEKDHKDKKNKKDKHANYGTTQDTSSSSYWDNHDPDPEPDFIEPTLVPSSPPSNNAPTSQEQETPPVLVEQEKPKWLIFRKDNPYVRAYSTVFNRYITRKRTEGGVLICPFEAFEEIEENYKKNAEFLLNVCRASTGGNRSIETTISTAIDALEKCFALIEHIVDNETLTKSDPIEIDNKVRVLTGTDGINTTLAGNIHKQAIYDVLKSLRIEGPRKEIIDRIRQDPAINKLKDPLFFGPFNRLTILSVTQNDLRITMFSNDSLSNSFAVAYEPGVIDRLKTMLDDIARVHKQTVKEADYYIKFLSGSAKRINILNDKLDKWELNLMNQGMAVYEFLAFKGNIPNEVVELGKKIAQLLNVISLKTAYSLEKEFELICKLLTTTLKNNQEGSL